MTTRRLSKRESVLNHPEEETRAMALPEGKICKDCEAFPRCSTLIGIDAKNEVCDWSPPRFMERIRTMTLGEAREILADTSRGPNIFSKEQIKAMVLGIEAIDVLIRSRLGDPPLDGELLPGETDE